MKILGVARTLLSLNVLLALGAASLVITTALIGGQSVPWWAAAVAWASVFAVYNFDRLADRTVGDGEASPRRRTLLERRARVVSLAVGAATLFVVAVCIVRGGAYAAWTLGFPLAGVAYVVPLVGGRRLKDIPYLKAFYVPGCWLLLLGQSVAATDAAWSRPVLLFAVFVFMRLFAACYIGDLRDLQQDTAAGVRTPAARLGRERSVRGLWALQGLSLTGWLGVVIAGWVPGFAGLLLLPAAIGLVSLWVWLSRPADPELVLELYDLEFVGFSIVLLAVAG